MRSIEIERVEFIVTYQCNSNCRHCLIQPCEHHDETMSPEFAREIAETLCMHYHPLSIMTFGGEPLLESVIDATLTIHHVAKHFHIPHRHLLTNGIWRLDWGRKPSSAIPSAEELQFIHEVASRVLDAGVTHIEISLDAFHQEILPVEYVFAAGAALKECGVPHLSFVPRWIISPDFECLENFQTRILLKIAYERHFNVGEGEMVQPRGNAVYSLSRYFNRVTLKGDEVCSEQTTGVDLSNIRGFCISPAGDLIICKNFILGRATPANIISLLDNFSYVQHPDLERLQSNGIQGLAQLAGEDPCIFLKLGFFSICDACFYFRKKAGFSKYCNA